jgi:hypothetical protein
VTAAVPGHSGGLLLGIPHSAKFAAVRYSPCRNFIGLTVDQNYLVEWWPPHAYRCRHPVPVKAKLFGLFSRERQFILEVASLKERDLLRLLDKPFLVPFTMTRTVRWGILGKYNSSGTIYN